ncbi:MAG: DUF6261 family protein [Cyclobacteriaceae bacterium]
MLQELSVSSLLSEELVTLSDRLIAVTTPPFDALLSRRIENVKLYSGFLADAINKKKKSEFTPILAEKDSLRDNAFRSFNFAVLSAVYNITPAISEAGKTVQEVIKRHDPSLYRLGYVAQTAEMKSLQQELDQLSDAIDLAGVQSQYNKMTQTMAAFNLVYKEKAEAESGVKKPTVLESKKELSRQVILLLRQIQIFVEDSEEGMDLLVEKYNEVLSSTMTLVRARRTRGNNKTDEEEPAQNSDFQDTEAQ